VQYFNEYELSEFQGAFEDVFYGARVKGWGAQLSAAVPLAGGTMLAGVGYMDGKMAKSEEWWFSKNDVTRIRATVGYAYPLSKRTEVYTGLGYGSSKLDASDDSSKYKSEETTVYVGMTHRF
jgi:predicted porin